MHTGSFGLLVYREATICDEYVLYRATHASRRPQYAVGGRVSGLTPPLNQSETIY